MPTKQKRKTIPMWPINECQLAELTRRWNCSEAEAVRRMIEETAAAEGVAFQRSGDGYELVHPPA